MKSNEIRKLLGSLFSKLGMLDEEQSKCCNLSLSQCHTLLSIGRNGNLSVNDLADELNVNKSTASRHVTQLVDKNLIERVESSQDRRYLELGLTEEGQNSFKTIENTMESYYTSIFNNIPEEKREQVIDSLKTLAEAINIIDCC